MKAIDPPPAETTQPPSTTIAPAVRALFTTAIGEWVIALNGNSEAVQRPTLPAELAQPISTALADLFAAVERAARAPVGDDVDGKALSRKAATVNQALAAHGIPFVIDTIVLPSDRAAATIVVFAFEVEKRRTLVVGDRAVPIAWVRRADNINLRYVVSGFTSEARRPLILLDSIDTLLTTLLGSESRTAAAARVAAVDVAGEPGGQLLDLLAARRALVERWSQAHAERGITFRAPEERIASAEWKKSVEGYVSDNELAELRALETKLAAPEIAIAYATLHQATTLATEKHELQHQLDLSTPIETDAAIGGVGDHRKQIVLELSANVAELARAGEHARLAFLRMARLARSSSNSVDRISFRATIGALANTELVIDGEALDVAIDSLLAMPALALSQRAKATWQRLFQRELVEARLQDSG